MLAVTNIVGPQIAREADGVLFTRAGLEIGVAATKTFLTQALAMLLLALYIGEKRGTIDLEQELGFTEELRRIPALLSGFLKDGAATRAEEVAARYASRGFFMMLGRNIGLPVALEGALKLKEITYVPTEAYSAGEMRHGPIALLEEGTPVVVVATDSAVHDKLISSMQEVRARGARVMQWARRATAAWQRWRTMSSSSHALARCCLHCSRSCLSNSLPTTWPRLEVGRSINPGTWPRSSRWSDRRRWGSRRRWGDH